MTPEVKELADALVQPSRAVYEQVRARVIGEVGYDAFRDRQREAFRHVCIGDLRVVPEDVREWG